MKLFGKILLGLLAAVVLLWLVVPGLPAYLFVTKSGMFHCIDQTLLEYPADYAALAPGDGWQTLTHDGLSVQVPADMYLKNPDLSVELYVNDDDMMVSFVDSRFADEETGEMPAPSFMFVDTEDGFTQKQFDRGMKGFDLKTPENNFEMFDFVFRFTPRDYKMTRHGTAFFFINMARMKDLLIPAYSDTVYEWETAGGRGFIAEYGRPTEKNKRWKILVELYDKQDLNHNVGLIIAAPGFEDALRIANTADFTAN